MNPGGCCMSRAVRVSTRRTASPHSSSPVRAARWWPARWKAIRVKIRARTDPPAQRTGRSLSFCVFWLPAPRLDNQAASRFTCRFASCFTYYPSWPSLTWIHDSQLPPFLPPSNSSYLHPHSPKTLVNRICSKATEPRSETCFVWCSSLTFCGSCNSLTPHERTHALCRAACFVCFSPLLHSHLHLNDAAGKIQNGSSQWMILCIR